MINDVLTTDNVHVNKSTTRTVMAISHEIISTKKWTRVAIQKNGVGKVNKSRNPTNFFT